VHLTEDKDTVRWNVKKYGKLRTSYSYKQIEFSGVRDLNRYAWYVVLSYPSKDQKLLVAFSSSQNTTRRPANRKGTEGERMVHIMWCCCKCRPYNVHLPNSMIRLVHRRAPMAELSNASIWFHYQILWPGWKQKENNKKKRNYDLDGLCFLDILAHQKWAGVPKQSYFLP